MEVADDKDARTVAERSELSGKLELIRYTDSECRRECKAMMWLKDQKAYGRLLETEADQLVREHGDAAYEAARAAMRAARNDGDHGLEKFFAKVAVSIAERSGREIGADTATRYVC